jgi:hypothetical protein
LALKFKGLASIITIIKSHRTKNHDESNKLANTARQTSIAGILVSLILFSLFGTLFFFHNKFIHFINQNLKASNQTNLTFINKIFENTANSTLRSKHKLHYEIISFYTASKSLNDIVTTKLSSSATSTVTSTITSTNFFNKTTNRISNRTSTKTMNSLQLNNSTRTLTNCTVKYYDKISILIDHDFLTNIFFKYKISKKKL